MWERASPHKETVHKPPQEAHACITPICVFTRANQFSRQIHLTSHVATWPFRLTPPPPNSPFRHRTTTSAFSALQSPRLVIQISRTRRRFRSRCIVTAFSRLRSAIHTSLRTSASSRSICLTLWAWDSVHPVVGGAKSFRFITRIPWLDQCDGFRRLILLLGVDVSVAFWVWWTNGSLLF